MISLSTPLSQLGTVGKATASRLKTLGISTARDLLFYYPFRYEDFSKIVPIAEAQTEEPITVRGTIIAIQNIVTPRKRATLTEAMIEDETGAIKAVWFNQPYLVQTLKQGDEISLSGKISYTTYGAQMTSPQYEKVARAGTNTGILAPVYPLTRNLTQKQLRFLVKQALSALPEIEEYLPETIKKQHALCDLHYALSHIHFPKNQHAVLEAEKRLKFDELFLLQLKANLSRSYIRQYAAPRCAFHENETREFVKSLGFSLTNAQKKSAWEILKDMEKPSPMNRLLEGDVGSGKTVVAAMACLNCVRNGYQAVYMAPTEILARQHFESFMQMFQDADVNIALYTRSHRCFARKGKTDRHKDDKLTKKTLLSKIAEGNADIIIGTHALIQEDVKFYKLGLAIIDEQHRFGVEQRKKLLCGGGQIRPPLQPNEEGQTLQPNEEGQTQGSAEGQTLQPNEEGQTQGSAPTVRPHFLSMTATPIPRSLALAVYGDLDLSVLDEMPLGRKTIITKLVRPEKRKDAYAFIEEQIGSGRQIFVICPLIDESDTLEVKAVTKEYEKIKNDIFSHRTVGLLHGKLKSAEKHAVQEKFSKGAIDILVATSVVEVGVNVPNASVMMIEGAERFGLAQLHQFRGRVGRADHQSYCFLFSDSPIPAIWARLKHIEKITSGFELAEIDLKLRGSGELYGTKQSGVPELKIATLSDYPLLNKAREIARAVIESGSYKLSPAFARKITKLKEEVHME